MFDSSLLSANRRDPQPLQEQIYAQLRELILNGRLKSGIRLPSSRSLAEDLHLSRNTILTAYDQLAAEGYIEGRQGAGSYVSINLPPESFHNYQTYSSTDIEHRTPATLSIR